MFKILLVIITAMFFTASSTAQASDVYQAFGVTQYQTSGQNMTAKPFSVGTFTDATSCNAEVANQNNLSLSYTPKSNTGAGQKVDAICHPVLSVQQPGYWIIGTSQVQQSNVASQSLDTKIGPFATLPICNARLVVAKGLTLQNTPKSVNNVGYALDADCVYLLSTSY